MSKFIEDFQKNNGLVADGVIGKNTLLKIKELNNIPTIEATAHFVGNTYHETGGFIKFVENLNYSAERLLVIFPKYFKTLEAAKKVAKNPEAIANIVYGGRMGNDSIGDGWKFKGRGALQTTGKTNYKLLGEYLKVDLLKSPELVENKYAFEAAAFYFKSNNLWSKANKVDDITIKTIRKAVNGGSIGLDEVNEKVREYYEILTKKK